MAILLMVCCSAHAKPKFTASEIADGGNQGTMVCDVDGDGLKDLVLIAGLRVSIFYQDRAQGFTHEPQQIYLLEPRPSIVWTAKLGRQAESLLVMTSDGVTELDFTNRSGPPSIRQIIKQRTIIPAVADDTNAMWLSMSAATGGDWPLLLVPTEDGIQVWQHRDEWRRAQVIDGTVDLSLSPHVSAYPGYTTEAGIDLGVDDINGDGRDDLIICHNQPGRTNTYKLYLQQTNGLFNLEPAMTYADQVKENSWLCWADLNRDGNVDLIKSVWLNEPSFLPGMASGKVLVSTYIADSHGRIPPRPQQVFRKSDWLPALPVLDVDGDGYPEMVLGYSQMDTREGFRKEITAKQLDYSLGFFFHRPGVGYPKEADFRRDVIIHLDEAAVQLGSSPRQYFARYVDLDGDFNGDGKKDLMVRDRGDEISVYFFVSREKGFSLKPDLRFNCPEQFYWWKIADLNNDGVSDLIVRLENQKGFRIFMSQK